ncbi:hypothetical protein DUNSADRAFT_612, partial [Dunaliella salina]
AVPSSPSPPPPSPSPSPPPSPPPFSPPPSPPSPSPPPPALSPPMPPLAPPPLPPAMEEDDLMSQPAPREADTVLRLAPRKPWEEAVEDLEDPLGDGHQKLPTVVTKFTVSGREGANVQDPGSKVLLSSSTFEKVLEWQVTSQLLQWGDPNVLAQSSNPTQITFANRPTPQSQPYIVKYSLPDDIGFAVQSVLRVVHLDCEKGEHKCEDIRADGTTKYSCSTDGLCVEYSVQSVSAGEGTRDRSRPSLMLEGPASVNIVQGDTYTRCNATQLESGDACERGAKASDSVQGDLAKSIQLSCFWGPRQGVEVGQHRYRCGCWPSFGCWHQH